MEKLGDSLEWTGKLDLEWVELIQEAKGLGLSIEEIREFLQYAVDLRYI